LGKQEVEEYFRIKKVRVEQLIEEIHNESHPQMIIKKAHEMQGIIAECEAAEFALEMLGK
jgi:hydroxypyruvate isomerase